MSLAESRLTLRTKQAQPQKTDIVESTPVSFAIDTQCGDDLQELCAINNPSDVEEIYYSRVCLWKNKKALSSSCTKFVTQSSPSIVEPCFDDINSFCSNVVPGYGRIHQCLALRSHETSQQCTKALFEDNIRAASEQSKQSKTQSDFSDDGNDKITAQIIAEFPTTTVTLTRLYGIVTANLFKPLLITSKDMDASNHDNENETDDSIIKFKSDDNDVISTKNRL